MESTRARYGLVVLSGAAGMLLLLLALTWARGASASEQAGPGTGAAITGEVTDGGGAPLSGISVKAYDAVSYQFLGLTTSAGDGSYVLANLSTPYNLVRVRFNHNQISQPLNESYVTQWYPAADHFLDSEVIAVTNGMTATGIDVSLEAGGALTVSVVLSGTGVPITNTFVNLYSADGSQRMNKNTGSTGQVVFNGIRPGVYAVQINDPFEQRIAGIAEWYPQQPTIDAAGRITITNGILRTLTRSVLALDLSVISTPRGGFRGRVIDERTGAPIPGVTVSLHETVTPFKIPVLTTQTDSQGNFIINGVPIFGSILSASHPDWFTSISEVLFSFPGQVQLLDDIALREKPGGLMKGLIDLGAPPRQQNEGSPWTGNLLLVSLVDETKGTVTTTLANFTGNYSFTKVPTGTFKLFFDGVSAVDEWYDDQSSQAAADTLSLSDGVTITADATLTASTGCIAGHVSDGASNPIPSAGVAAYEPNVSQVLAHLVTAADSNGDYDLCALGSNQQGDYALRFTDYLRVPEWHDGSYFADGDDFVPAPVSVGAGVMVTVDGVLDTLGGCIHGVVRRPSGLRQPFANLTIRNQAGDPVYFYNNGSPLLSQSGVSDFSGEFAACGFPSGSYTVEAEYQSIFEILASDPEAVTAAAGAVSGPFEVNLSAVTANPVYLPVITK